LDNASEVLIVPFQKILEELTLQAQAWLMIHKSLEQTARLPDYFEDVENHKNDFSGNQLYILGLLALGRF
jgi:hypothetical protein